MRSQGHAEAIAHEPTEQAPSAHFGLGELHPLLKLKPPAPKLAGRCHILHMRDLGVRLAQRREYLVEVCWLSAREGYCFAFQPTLAKKLGCSVRTVYAMQRWAADAGYLTVVPTGRENLLFPNWKALRLLGGEVADQSSNFCRSLSLDRELERSPALVNSAPSDQPHAAANTRAHVCDAAPEPPAAPAPSEPVPALHAVQSERAAEAHHSAAALSRREPAQERAEAEQALGAVVQRFGARAGRQAALSLRQAHASVLEALLALTALLDRYGEPGRVSNVGGMIYTFVQRARDGALDDVAQRIEERRQQAAARAEVLRRRQEADARAEADRRARAPSSAPPPLGDRDVKPDELAEGDDGADEALAAVMELRAKLGAAAPSPRAKPAVRPLLHVVVTPERQARVLLTQLAMLAADSPARPRLEEKLRALVDAGIVPEPEELPS